MQENLDRQLVTTLTEQQLRNFNCNDDEVALILEFQELLPVLCQDGRIEKFCVDARTLHEQLTNADTTSKFADWIKKNLRDYEENVDYKLASSTNEAKLRSSKQHGGQNKKDYLLTLDLAKEIAMFTGRNSQASVELKRRSRLVRKYFILMDNVAHDMKLWTSLREKNKKGYKPMDLALAEYIIRNEHREPEHWDFKREANMINIILFGYKAQNIRLMKSILIQKPLRDCLTTAQQAYIDEAQELNTTLLNANVEERLRYKIIYNSFVNKHPNPETVSDDIETINCHRKEIGIEVNAM